MTHRFDRNPRPAEDESVWLSVLGVAFVLAWWLALILLAGVLE